jgi:hypothetical protein
MAPDKIGARSRIRGLLEGVLCKRADNATFGMSCCDAEGRQTQLARFSRAWVITLP